MAVAGKLMQQNNLGLNSTPVIGNTNYYNDIVNFEIEKPIGKGQFSEVFRARCLLDNRVVALKKVKVS